MGNFNMWILFVTALIPLAVGFVWYNKKVFGTTWLAVSGVDEEKAKKANMLVVFGLSYLFSLFLSSALMGITIHQMGVYSTLANEPGINEPNSEMGMYFKNFMDKYGKNFRTFKHGAFHGFLTGIFLALPILGVNALFENKGFKYIAINVGFWTVCTTLMGGVICAFL